MRILVVGSGGREHALVWKLAQSSRVTRLYAAPGNPGIAGLAECVSVKADDIDGLLAFAEKSDIDLTVVGPEAPLAAGIADRFLARGMAIFGPVRAAAAIESSKAFAKELMAKYNIPTAKFSVFTEAQAAINYIREQGAPIVIKADGLAAGKGVIVAMDEATAVGAVEQIMVDKTFGAAGNRVVIEEYLEGEEASVLAFCDGTTVAPMVAAQDHKRVFDGDRGPNTGGMGAYAPAPVVTPGMMERVVKEILAPTVAAMKREGREYRGVLYAGLMITATGPKVIEFNARFGDPETQVILPLLASDLVDICAAVVRGRLAEQAIQWHDGAAVCVVLAAGGYPGDYRKGDVITGLDTAMLTEGVTVFHAGTAKAGGQVVTAGGRVLGVTARGADLRRALAAAYGAAGQIFFAGMHYRRDIAHRALGRKG